MHLCSIKNAHELHQNVENLKEIKFCVGKNFNFFVSVFLYQLGSVKSKSQKKKHSSSQPQHSMDKHPMAETVYGTDDANMVMSEKVNCRLLEKSIRKSWNFSFFLSLLEHFSGGCEWLLGLGGQHEK